MEGKSQREYWIAWDVPMRAPSPMPAEAAQAARMKKGEDLPGPVQERLSEQVGC